MLQETKKCQELQPPVYKSSAPTTIPCSSTLSVTFIEKPLKLPCILYTLKILPGYSDTVIMIIVLNESLSMTVAEWHDVGNKTCNIFGLKQDSSLM